MSDHNCTDLQLLRKGMMEELEAVNKYEKFADEADSEEVRELFLDIAQEEKVHMVEFLEMMERFDSSWEEAEEEGEEEIESMFGEDEEEDEDI